MNFQFSIILFWNNFDFKISIFKSSSKAIAFFSRGHYPNLIFLVQNGITNRIYYDIIFTSRLSPDWVTRVKSY